MLGLSWLGIGSSQTRLARTGTTSVHSCRLAGAGVGAGAHCGFFASTEHNRRWLLVQSVRRRGDVPRDTNNSRPGARYRPVRCAYAMPTTIPVRAGRLPHGRLESGRLPCLLSACCRPGNLNHVNQREDNYRSKFGVSEAVTA
jgi:hypothetical protein